MKLIIYLGVVIAVIYYFAFIFAQEIMEDQLEALPSHWSQMRIEEPVFGGEVHVVETGVTHKDTIVLVDGIGYKGLAIVSVSKPPTKSWSGAVFT